MRVSIEDFDPAGFKTIDSPFSVKAMQVLGLSQADLRLKRREDIIGIVRDADPVKTEETVKVFLEKNRVQVEALLEEVKKARNKLKVKANEAK